MTNRPFVLVVLEGGREPSVERARAGCSFLGTAVLLLVGLMPMHAAAQTVAMSGEYGASHGRSVNFPINPPRTVCTNTQNARCHYGEQLFPTVPSTIVDPLAGPASGVGVPGAGIRVIEGGLNVGDVFTLPPGAFRQAAGPQFTPIVDNVVVRQLDTSFAFSMPAASRAVGPPPATRVFQPNAWNAPGNGQTGRGAANTTPISTGTQATHEITVRYKAGLNAFGGTMAAMQDGEGRIYLEGPVMGSVGNPATMPWIGTNQFGDGILNNPITRFGAGWNYTRMYEHATGIIKNLGGLAPPCTAATPAAPAGCGLVTNFSGFTIGTIPAEDVTRHVFAWTTGTVEVLQGGTIGGFPSEQLLTAMGYDTTSTTLSGGTVRNIGLVAGAFTRRTSSLGTPFRNGHEIVGLDMQFAPEPGATAALSIGVAGLMLLAARREA
ncbi:MAG: hypothetical protein AB8G23_17990 [Myxococcota bacterium]